MCIKCILEDHPEVITNLAEYQRLTNEILEMLCESDFDVDVLKVKNDLRLCHAVAITSAGATIQ